MSLIDRLACFLVPLLFATATSALTIRPPSFSELVGTADVVVIGEVIRTESVLKTVEGRSVPFTLVTLRVTETLKGQASTTVVLQCLGGTVGADSLRVVGAPEFVSGDRGFFFIQNNGAQFFPLVAVTHGVYWAVADTETGVDLILRANGEPLSSVQAVGNPIELPQSRPKLFAAPPRGALTTTEFAQQIKQEASRETR